MTNSQNLGTIEATNPVLAVAPLKEETEMLRATDKITALYCRLSVEDMKEDKKGGKEDVSNSIQNQKMILLQYAKRKSLSESDLFRGRGCNNRTKNIKAQKVSETRCFLSFFTQKPQVKQSASVYPKWRLGRQTRFFHVLTQ